MQVCPDCGTQSPVSNTHTCGAQGQRMAVELVEGMLGEIETAYMLSFATRSTLDLQTGCGVLWLIRILYRLRQKISGMEMYGDRALMARIACELGGELIK